MCIKGKLVFYIGGGIVNDRTRSIGSGGSSGESVNKGMMNVSRYGESAMNNNKDYPNKYKKYIFKEGDWECPHQNCKNINFSRRTKCNKCGVPKPQSTYYSNSSSSYGHSGNSGRFRGISSRYRSGNSNYRSISHSRSRSRSRSSRSPRSRTLIKKHHYQSKYTSSRSYSRSSHSRERDRERVHERSYQQGQQQSQSQKKSYFGGPPGLFKEGDWRCENCQNINFKWRVICNKCQYSKRDEQNIDHRRSSSYYGESRGSSNRYHQNVSSSHKGRYNGYYRNESGSNNNGNSNSGAMNLNMRNRSSYGEGYGSGYGYVYGYGKERELNRNEGSDNKEKRHDKSSSSSSSSRKKSSSSPSSRKSSSSSSGSKTPRSDSSSKSDGTQ